MTPANADLLALLREALDHAPSARLIADIQALRNGLHEVLFGPFGYGPIEVPDNERGRRWTDTEMITIVAMLVSGVTPLSMSERSDAADAKQLRDRVRALETRNLALEQETLDEREEVARLRMWLITLEAKLKTADETICATIESDRNDLNAALDTLRETEQKLDAANLEIVGLPQAVAVTELASSMSVEEIARLRAELAEANVRLASWRTWARETYDSIAPIEERHEDHRWYAMTDDQVRLNVSAQVELLDRRGQFLSIAPASNPDHDTAIDALVNARIAETNNKQPAA